MSLETNISEDSSSSNASLLDLTSLRTLDEIKAAFTELTKEEANVEVELERILDRQVLLEADLRGLSHLASLKLHAAENESTKLSSVISRTAKLADGVASKVKQLDLAKSRVSDCRQRVNDLIDLRLCSDGVRTALADEDYEQAAAHLHRFLSMDESLLKLTASELTTTEEVFSLVSGSSQGGMASLESAIRTLHEAEEKVKVVISNRFDEAVAQEDLASVERFFKIFPLINMHEEGLKKFTAYLSSKVIETAKNNLHEASDTPSTDPRASVIYADTLTLLFEGIARTIEIHQPLIETYYGPGRLMTVLFILQAECDRQSEQILKQFRRKRNLNEKLHRVRELSKITTSDHSTGSSSVESASSKIAAKEMDLVLGEVALLHARGEMYFKFFRKRAVADIEFSTNDRSVQNSKISNLDLKILDTGLCRMMQELVSDYIQLEDFYMSSNVKKALEQHQNDMASTQESFENSSLAGATTFNSLLLDDVFYVVKKCVRRAMSSQSIDGVCAITNNAVTILETDFCGLLQTHLRMGFPSGYLDLTMNVIQASFQQGYKMAAAQATSDSEKQKAVFLCAINTADCAGEYVTRLIEALEMDLASLFSARKTHDREKVESCLAGFQAVASKLKSVLDQGINQLRQSAVKPRIKPWMDNFVSHDIDENQFADYEANDPFVQCLIVNLNNLLETFRRGLTPTNFDALVAILTSEVIAQLEKAVLKSKFSRLGGLLLDREIRSLVSFLSSGATWSVREKFSRLTQMALLLNVETVSEVSDIWGAGTSAACHLSPAEVRQVLTLRTDFKSEEIRRLRF